ncbi:MAG: AtpZ/AtpI family protein [Geobacteraceae bacterium]|nr:AtpZ/AtpI family protein [Geobacteraceae bacterium]
MDEFKDKVGKNEQRKLKALRDGEQSVWFGLGMFGLIGWSIAIPMLIGIALGIWLDNRLGDRISWTLTFLLVGVVVGCLNAWYWLSKERKEIERQEKHDE